MGVALAKLKHFFCSPHETERLPSSRSQPPPRRVMNSRRLMGHDQVTSLRFSDALTGGIKGSELVVFETCSHAPIYQSTVEFNEKTLGFLNRHAG